MITSAVHVAVVLVALPVLALLGRRALRGERSLSIAATMLLLVVSSTGPPEVLDAAWVAGYEVSLFLLLATFPDGRFRPPWSMVLVAWIVLLGVVQVAWTAPEDLPVWTRGSVLVGLVVLLGCQVFRYLRRSSAHGPAGPS